MRGRCEARYNESSQPGSTTGRILDGVTVEASMHDAHLLEKLHRQLTDLGLLCGFMGGLNDEQSRWCHEASGPSFRSQKSRLSCCTLVMGVVRQPDLRYLGKRTTVCLGNWLLAPLPSTPLPSPSCHVQAEATSEANGRGRCVFIPFLLLHPHVHLIADPF